MCEPISIMTGLGLASAVASTAGGIVNAGAQRDMLEETATAQAGEISDAAEAQIGDRVRAGRRERARMLTAGSEAGLQVSGSFESALRDSLFQQGQDTADIRAQAEQQNRSLGLRVQQESSFITADTPLGILSSGLQIADSGLRGYNAGLSIKDARNRRLGGP